LRVEILEGKIHSNPYTQSYPGGVTNYLDNFQADMAELEVLAKKDYSEDMKRQILFSNLRNADHVAHLIQTCKDQKMEFLEACTYLHKNSVYIDHYSNQSSRIHKVEQAIPNPNMSSNDILALFNKMASKTSAMHAFNALKSPTMQGRMHIPNALWKIMEQPLQDKIMELKKAATTKRDQSWDLVKTDPSSEKLPPQYPSTMAKLQSDIESTLNSLNALQLDDDDTDDEILYSMNTISIIPNDHELRINMDIVDFYMNNMTTSDTIYGLSDGGANSCLLGQKCKVVSYTGRAATLVGYKPGSTRKPQVPIITGLLKVMSHVNIPILLRVHQAPYLKECPVTLLSEYQIREFGLVIDSCSKKHQLTPDRRYGTQSFYVSEDVHIHFEDRGGLMGIQLLDIEDTDEEQYDIFDITAKQLWIPCRFREDITLQESDTTEDLMRQRGEAIMATQQQERLNQDQDQELQVEDCQDHHHYQDLQDIKKPINPPGRTWEPALDGESNPFSFDPANKIEEGIGTAAVLQLTTNYESLPNEDVTTFLNHISYDQ
jgi:hypothetical protein